MIRPRWRVRAIKGRKLDSEYRPIQGAILHADQRTPLCEGQTLEVVQKRPAPVHGRKLECLERVADGHTSEEITDELDISSSTFRQHMMAARREVGEATTVGAVARGIREGWL